MIAKTTEVKESECAGTSAKEKVLTISLVRPRRKFLNLFPVSMIYNVPEYTIEKEESKADDRQ